jgi:hypothetical protein
MPRYFFDLVDDLVKTDEIGRELQDLDDARREAVAAVARIAHDLLPDGGIAKSLRCNVRDEVGNVVLHAEIVFKVSYGG